MEFLKGSQKGENDLVELNKGREERKEGYKRWLITGFKIFTQLGRNLLDPGRKEEKMQRCYKRKKMYI